MLKKTLLLTLTICVAASLSISRPAFAQMSEFKITASDGAASDWFGISASISGDYAVVGAHKDDDNGDASGSAYVFKRSGTIWTQEAKLLPSDGAALDNFGYSVSISGDYAVVGARQGDNDNEISTGSAYVFKRTGTSWTEETKLLATDGMSGDYYGSSVSISGDYAVVGALWDDDNGDASGSAYVFKRTGTSWAQEAKLLPFDGETSDRFGSSVAISGDYAVVGAFADDDNGIDAGSAYVFQRTGTSWTEEAKLLPFDGAALDNFGSSVSISGDYAVVGAFTDDDNGDASGSAYLFKRTGSSWTQEAKILASDGAAKDLFGSSVAISGDYALVGALWDDDNGSASGSAYLFKRTGTSWVQKAKLLASDGTTFDRFGSSVSISGDYALVGAWLDDDNGSASGSAYLYSGVTSPVEVGEVSVSPAYVIPGIDSVVVKAAVVGPANLYLFAEIETPDQAPLDSLPLFDDGTHHDGEAGDGIFGNAWAAPLLEERIYFVDLHISYADTDTVSFELNNRGIFTTTGPLVLDSYTLFDTLPNPGESLFLKLAFKNKGSTAIATAITANISTIDTCVTNITVEGQNTYGDIGPEVTATTNGAYIVDTNVNCAGGEDILFDISIASEGFDFWSESVSIRLVPGPPTIRISLEQIRTNLLDNPPNGGDAVIREATILALDNILKTDSSRIAQSVSNFYIQMMKKVETELSETVEKGATIWMMYNHGFIVKTPEIVFAFDLVNGHHFWSTILPSGLLSQIDVVFLSHRHLDHYNQSILTAVMNNGDFVVYPSEDPNSYGNTPMAPGDSINLLGLEIKAYDGLHPVPVRIYEVTTSSGFKILHTGDNGTSVTLPDIENLDILLLNAWVNEDGSTSSVIGMRNSINKLKPKVMIPGHIHELGHSPEADQYKRAFEVDDVPISSQVQVMAWGEKYIVSEIVGIMTPVKTVPTYYTLSQNYPNPFNPVTTIKYTLPKSSDVNLTVFNILGEEVARLINDTQPIGIHRVTWDASSLASGIYFYRLQAGEFIQTKKMVLLK